MHQEIQKRCAEVFVSHKMFVPLTFTWSRFTDIQLMFRILHYPEYGI